MLSLSDHAVVDHFEHLGDAGRHQDVTSVGAGAQGAWRVLGELARQASGSAAPATT